MDPAVTIAQEAVGDVARSMYALALPLGSGHRPLRQWFPGLLGQAQYNFGCGAATAGRPREEALMYLGHAIDQGLAIPKAIAAAPELKSLHGGPTVYRAHCVR